MKTDRAKNRQNREEKTAKRSQIASFVYILSQTEHKHRANGGTSDARQRQKTARLSDVFDRSGGQPLPSVPGHARGLHGSVCAWYFGQILNGGTGYADRSSQKP